MQAHTHAHTELNQTVKKSASKSFYAFASIITAVLSSLPMLYFIRSSRYQDIWILWIGDMIFLLSMVVITYYLNRNKAANATTGSMLIAGHTITAISTVLLCIILFVALSVIDPSIYDSSKTNIIRNEPSWLSGDKNDGMFLILFAHAVLVTFGAGSFASLVTSYTIKGNQTKDRAEV